MRHGPNKMLRNDVRYPWRLMRRNPGFTAVAGTAICSRLSTVRPRPLPVVHPQRQFLQERIRQLK